MVTRMWIKNTIGVLITIIYVALMLWLPKGFEMIPSNKVKFILVAVFSLIFVIYLLFQTYWDIKKARTIKSKSIVVTDLIIIVSFAVLAYLTYLDYGDILKSFLISTSLLQIVFILAMSVRAFFKLALKK